MLRHLPKPETVGHSSERRQIPAEALRTLSARTKSTGRERFEPVSGQDEMVELSGIVSRDIVHIGGDIQAVQKVVAGD